ncbi:MAG: hypothetical protein RSB82_02725 [Victivallaceae bacterium]
MKNSVSRKEIRDIFDNQRKNEILIRETMTSSSMEPYNPCEAITIFDFSFLMKLLFHSSEDFLDIEKIPNKQSSKK